MCVLSVNRRALDLQGNLQLRVRDKAGWEKRRAKYAPFVLSRFLRLSVTGSRSEV